jgi:hypothetical protein
MRLTRSQNTAAELKLRGYWAVGRDGDDAPRLRALGFAA